MLTIIIPNNNISEREYIIKVLISDFLGLNYILNIDNTNLVGDYVIECSNKKLVIRDSFFNNYLSNLSYLSINSLPGKVIFGVNEFMPEKNIPIIYGTNEITVKENIILCGIDIFASSYFMLTRWEEYVNKVRDEHVRMPASESIAFLNGFLHRPVVNEYIEMLWSLLIEAGYKGERKKKAYNLVLTHDIDHLDYPMTSKIILGDILKRRNLKLAKEHLLYYTNFIKNPYDTFGFIMSISEKLGLQSHFYFMSSDLELQPDTRFYLKGKRFKNKIKEIKARGHIIGFHPGYYTYNNKERWSNEKTLLEDAVQTKILEGRQHYLRFDIPETFRIWDNNCMEVDSSLGYAHKEGFRCGTGDIFQVFDFTNRKELNLKECPLVLMDGTLKRQYSIEEALKVIKYYIEISKKYKSSLTSLFHNSTFYGDSWKGYDLLYYDAFNN